MKLSIAHLYPDLLKAYRSGQAPKPSKWNPRQNNTVRYEMMTRLGYFVTESSEHFAEYTPYFIKEGREDLIEKFRIPLDEYPKRCVEQIARWKNEISRRQDEAKQKRLVDAIQDRVRDGRLSDGDDSAKAYVQQLKDMGSSAASAYQRALARAGKEWPRRSEALLGLLSSLRKKDAAACADVGRAHVGEVKGAALPADFASVLLSCAAALPDRNAQRAAREAAVARLRSIVESPPADSSAVSHAVQKASWRLRRTVSAWSSVSACR